MDSSMRISQGTAGKKTASVLQSFSSGGRRYTALLGSGAFGHKAWNPENLPSQLPDNLRPADSVTRGRRCALCLRVKSTRPT